MNDQDGGRRADAQGPERARPSRFFEWLLLRSELSRARFRVQQTTPQQIEFLRRARLASELASLSDRDRLRSGSGAAVVVDLFRQAIYWALRAQLYDPGHLPPEAVWSAPENAVRGDPKAGAGDLAELELAVRSNFIDLAERSAEQQQHLRKLLKRAAARLIADAERPRLELEWLKVKQAARVFILLLPMIATLVAVAVWNNCDLAKGAAWRTSSIEMVCHPERSECGGVTTNILFHTKFEKSPWFEYDFGNPIAFSALTIRNRTDYRPELALPLIAEISNDGHAYREVARRSEVFLTWRPEFATQRARYLRLRVLKPTFFHLERIEVYR